MEQREKAFLIAAIDLRIEAEKEERQKLKTKTKGR